MNQRTIWGTLTGLVIFVLLASRGQAGTMPSAHSNSTSQFRRVEQPFGLKIVVTLGGLGLIGVELWWFLYSQHQTKKADLIEGVQELTISVDGGYQPSLIVVKSGRMVRLNFLRKDKNSCLEKVLLPDFYIAQDLPLNQVTTVEFTPQKTGKYPFTCGMSMFHGEIEVQ